MSHETPVSREQLVAAQDPRSAALMAPPPTQDLLQFHLAGPLRAGVITEVVSSGCYVQQRDGTTVLRPFTERMFENGEMLIVEVGDFWVVFANGQEGIASAKTFQDNFVSHVAPAPWAARA